MCQQWSRNCKKYLFVVLILLKLLIITVYDLFLLCDSSLSNIQHFDYFFFNCAIHV